MRLNNKFCLAVLLYLFCFYCQAQGVGRSDVVGVYGSDGQWQLPILEDDEVQIYQFGEKGLSDLMKHTRNKSVEIRVFQSINPTIERLLNPDSDEEPRCPDEDDEPMDDPKKMVVLGCNGGAPDTVSFVSEFLKNQADVKRVIDIRNN